MINKIDILKEQAEQAGEFVDAYTELHDQLKKEAIGSTRIDKARIKVEILEIKANIAAKVEYKENFELDIKNREAELKARFNAARDNEKNLLKAGKTLLDLPMLLKPDLMRITGLIQQLETFKRKRENKLEINKNEYISISDDLKSITEKYLKQ